MKTRVFNLCFSLVFCLGLASCNKEEFYQKDYLNTPTDVPANDGSANGGDQDGSNGGSGDTTQGGVDSGVNGGSTGGATTGSSTGGNVGGATVGGGVDGSVVGGVDGSTVGGTTGSTVGGTDGATTGSSTAGSTTGSTVGGSTTGSTVGGSTTGSTVGGSTGGTTGAVQVLVTENFNQAAEETKKLDIVWIIDDSGSMADEQSALGTNFSAFINDFIDRNVDFKMAITTTDTSSSTRKGRIVPGSDTKLTSAMAQANETQFKSDFRNLVKVGTSGSGNEKGLEASEGFMQKYANTFLRSDAYLAVVIISDEEDQSPKAVAQYTDYLKQFKNNDGLIKVYSIVDVNNTNSGSGVTVGSARYKDASNRTAGLVGDIREDFYHTLEDMGESIIKLLDSFALANDPVPGSLKVYVNNVETSGYTYDAASRSIKFNSNNLPPVGANIKVTYLK